jgi:hypothetical protein
MAFLRRALSLTGAMYCGVGLGTSSNVPANPCWQSGPFVPLDRLDHSARETSCLSTSRDVVVVEFRTLSTMVEQQPVQYTHKWRSFT